MLEGWTSARTAGNGSIVAQVPDRNAIDVEADNYPLKDPNPMLGLPGINTPVAPPSGMQVRDWTSGGGGPSMFDRLGGPERK